MKLPVSSPPILFVCLLLSGCRNAPGDLAMQVTCPTDVAEPGKPMPLTVTLTALNGPLCLGKMPAFTAELQHEASGQTWTSRPICCAAPAPP